MDTMQRDEPARHRRRSAGGMLTPMTRTLSRVALLVFLLTAASARAQTDEELRRARELFAEGVALTQDERWEEAIDRFRQVLAVRPTPQVKYNLALALEGAGQLAAAADLLREIQDSRRLDRATRRDVQRLLDAIGPRLAQIVVRLHGDEAGMRVQVDGHDVPLDRIGRPVVVSPGEHRVALLRRGREVAARTVYVSSGDTEEVTLVETVERERPNPEASDPAVPAQPQPAPAPSNGEIVEQWWFWTVIGAVVIVAVAVGVAAGTSGRDEPESTTATLMPAAGTPTLFEIRWP